MAFQRLPTVVQLIVLIVFGIVDTKFEQKEITNIVTLLTKSVTLDI